MTADACSLVEIQGLIVFTSKGLVLHFPLLFFTDGCSFSLSLAFPPHTVDTTSAPSSGPRLQISAKTLIQSSNVPFSCQWQLKVIKARKSTMLRVTWRGSYSPTGTTGLYSQWDYNLLFQPHEE